MALRFQKVMIMNIEYMQSIAAAMQLDFNQKVKYYKTYYKPYTNVKDVECALLTKLAKGLSSCDIFVVPKNSTKPKFTPTLGEYIATQSEYTLLIIENPEGDDSNCLTYLIRRTKRDHYDYNIFTIGIEKNTFTFYPRWLAVKFITKDGKPDFSFDIRSFYDIDKVHLIYDKIGLQQVDSIVSDEDIAFDKSEYTNIVKKVNLLNMHQAIFAMSTLVMTNVCNIAAIPISPDRIENLMRIASKLPSLATINLLYPLHELQENYRQAVAEIATKVVSGKVSIPPIEGKYVTTNNILAFIQK